MFAFWIPFEELESKKQLLVFSAVPHHRFLSFEDCKRFSSFLASVHVARTLLKPRPASVYSKINRTESKLKYERKKNKSNIDDRSP